MLNIQKNVSLAKYTTLKIGAAAEFFAVIESRDDLQEAISWAKKNKRPIFVLGGGSNLLVSKRFRGLVLKNEIKGVQISSETKDETWLTGNSGEIWSSFVDYAVKHKLYGLENLYLIYGTVGAAPVQNIGAYGVEIKDVFDSLVAIDLKTGREKTFFFKDCRFGYRDSIFKNKLKGRYFIYSVTVRLSKQSAWKLDYGSIKEELKKQKVRKPNLPAVIKAIETIRNSKLPNPFVLPNAGSFFKNTEITKRQFKKLQTLYPDIPSFPASQGKVKIPTGWLIEQTGFRGRKIGPVAMYEKQALILVNYGGAQAKDVLKLVKAIKMAVKKKFGLEIEEEVNVI